MEKKGVNPDNKKKLLKRLGLILGFFLIFILLCVSAGFLAKNYVVNHSEEWIGRKVSIGKVWVNPFNASVSIIDFKLYENQSDTIFFSFDKVYVNLAPLDLLSRNIKVEEFHLQAPSLRLVLAGEIRNFDDLLQRFSDKDSSAAQPVEEGDPYTYQIESIKLSSGKVKFYNFIFNTGIGINEVNFYSPIVASNKSVINGHLDLKFLKGGALQSDFDVDVEKLTYHLNVKGDSLNIAFLLPFIDKVMYASSLEGKIDADLKLGGHFETSVSEASGFVRLSSFALSDTLQQTTMQLDKLEIALDSISAIEGNYRVKHVLLDKPFLRFDLTPTGNNIFRSFAAADSTYDDSGNATQVVERNSNIEDDYLEFFSLLGGYFADLGRAYAIKFYSIDSLGINDGDIQFDDYTLEQRFHFQFTELNVDAGKLRSNQDTIVVRLNSRLNDSGELNAKLNFMPKDTGHIHLEYNVVGLKVSDFSPYSEHYVAHPFWDGIVTFKSTSTINHNLLNSKNNLFIEYLEVGDKVQNQTAFNLPIKLAVSLLKDADGNVDLSIPVKGNLKDPEFKYFPIIAKIFKDLIIKAVTSPFKMLAQAFNVNEDELRDVKYDYLQYSIERYQTKSLKTLTKVLNQKEDLKVKLVHFNNPDWEMNQYALFEAKRNFYIQDLDGRELTFEDSVNIDNVQRIDSSFVQFVMSKVGPIAQTNIEMACKKLVGEELLQSLLNETQIKRVTTLNQYLIENIETENRFEIIEATEAEKEKYHERPKFVFLFEAMEDS